MCNYSTVCNRQTTHTQTHTEIERKRGKRKLPTGKIEAYVDGDKCRRVYGERRMNFNKNQWQRIHWHS